MLPDHFDVTERLLKRSFQVSDPIVGAEIGVSRGELSAPLLKYYTSLQLDMVDRWDSPKNTETYQTTGDIYAILPQECHEKHYKMACEAVLFAGNRAKIIRGELLKVASLDVECRYDFIYLDADHSYEGTLAALRAWGQLVKPGGIISGHDWGRWGVSKAVNDYKKEQGNDTRFRTGKATSWGYIK